MISIAESARLLVAEHHRADPVTEAAYFLPSASEVILIEVSADFDSGGEVLPFGFKARPDLGVPYPLVMVLLSKYGLAARPAR